MTGPGAKGSHLAKVVFALTGSLLLHISFVAAIVALSPYTYRSADIESDVILLSILPEHAYREVKSIGNSSDGADVMPSRPSRKARNKANVTHYRAQDKRVGLASVKKRKPSKPRQVQSYGVNGAHGSSHLHTTTKPPDRAISHHSMRVDGDDGYMAG